MSTETPAPGGASFAGAGIEPGIRPDAQPVADTEYKPTAPVHRPVDTPTPPKAPKPPKVKRVAPEGAAIPTMGWPGLVYRFNLLRGRADLVPAKLSAKESALLAERAAKWQADHDRETKKTWLSAYFNSARTTTVERVNVDGVEQDTKVELSWEAQSLVVALLTQKGGACKTEGTVQLSRTFAKRLQSVDNPEATPPVGPILIIPATRNPGSTTRKAGVASEDTLTLPETEELLKRLEAEEEQARQSSTTPSNGNVSYISAESITSHLRKNGDGVYVLAQSQLPPDFDDQRFRWVLERLKKIFPLIILDTGNNTAKVGEIEYMAAYMADVLVFVCYTGMDGSPELMGLTMDSYHILPQKEKLSASISVIHGLRPSDSLDDWARYAEFKINEHGHTVGIRDFPYRVSARGGQEQTGTLLSIPWDDALYLHRGNDIAQETEDAYLELAFQIALTNGRLKDLDFTKLDRIRSIKKMIAEFDESLLNEHYPTPQAWIAAQQRGEIPST
jgi:cellulose biosynthesis protein BcsQ